MSLDKRAFYVTSVRYVLLHLSSYYDYYMVNWEAQAHDSFPNPQGYTFFCLERLRPVFCLGKLVPCQWVSRLPFHISKSIIDWCKVWLQFLQSSASIQDRTLLPQRPFHLRAALLTFSLVCVDVVPWSWHAGRSHWKPEPGSSDPSPSNLLSSLGTCWVLHH